MTKRIDWKQVWTEWNKWFRPLDLRNKTPQWLAQRRKIEELVNAQLKDKP